MLKTTHPWMKAKIESTHSENQFSQFTDIDREATPYIIIGAHGYDSSNPALAASAFAAQAGVLAARDAMTSDEPSALWKIASEKLKGLVPINAAVPHDDVLCHGGSINVAYISAIGAPLSSACAAASIYHDSQHTHNDEDALQSMADHAVLASPYNVLDISRVRSRLAIVRCETALRAADDAVTSSADPGSAAADYQQNVAKAMINFNVIQGNMRTPDLVKRHAAAVARVTTDFSPTFSSVFHSVSVEHTDGGSPSTTETPKPKPAKK